MVKLLLMLIPFFLFCAEVTIEVLPDRDALLAGRPVEGTLMVTYPSLKNLERGSFIYEKKPLNPDFLRRVEVTGREPQFIDSFRFKLPPFQAGSHTINPVSVSVDGVSYNSAPVTIEVNSLVKGEGRKPILHLEKIYLEEGPLYPGQKAKVGYRYLFRGDIELKEEVLPLLDQDIFVKLGDKSVEDSQKGDISVREITQKIEMNQSGVFVIPTSHISGYEYQDKGWGSRTYFEPILQSIIPSFKLVVNPFPEEGKPPFFNGSLGPFEMDASASIPPKVGKGERFTFTIRFRGKGVHTTLKAPNLMCLPGWAGFFRAGDLPAQKKVEGELTLFSYEVRPVSVLATEVPPVWFSYFDPFQRKYIILSSQPIPIEVTESSSLVKEMEVEPLKIIPFKMIPLAKTFSEEKSINDLLKPYLKIEKESALQSASFYKELAEGYKEAEKIPEAIWAYQQSLVLNPWNASLKENLYKLLDQYNLPKTTTWPLPDVRLLQISTLFFMAFLLFIRKEIARYLFGTLTLIPLFILAFHTWLIPANGIIMTPSYLLELPQPNAVKVSNSPIPAGLQVEVLSEEENGTWLKIKDLNGQIGFVPFNSIRLIQ